MGEDRYVGMGWAERSFCCTGLRAMWALHWRLSDWHRSQATRSRRESTLMPTPSAQTSGRRPPAPPPPASPPPPRSPCWAPRSASTAIAQDIYLLPGPLRPAEGLCLPTAASKLYQGKSYCSLKSASAQLCQHCLAVCSGEARCRASGIKLS
jgi:hypothetical protein